MATRTLILIVLIALLSVNLSAQTDISFSLKEAIDLPGGGAADLVLYDITGDGYLDYVYRDSLSVFLLNGLDHQLEFEYSYLPWITAIAVGDLNSDGVIDIGIAGRYSNSPDTCYASFFLGSNFDSVLTYRFPDDSGLVDGAPTAMWFGQYHGQNLVFLGMYNHYSYSDDFSGHYWDNGRLNVVRFYNNSFSQIRRLETNGAVVSIKPVIKQDSLYLLVQSKGYELAGNDYIGLIIDKIWADLNIVGQTLTLSSLWHTPGSDGNFAKGWINGLCIGSANPGENESVIFSSNSDTPLSTTLQCYRDSWTSYAWQRSGDYMTYKNALANILGRGSKDLLVFNSFYQLRDPVDGYVFDIGNLLGQQGNYVGVADQENDGTDEFFYVSSNALHVYYPPWSTAVSEGDSFLPKFAVLKGNYPNPFNSSTIIQFELSKETTLKLEIFDILGRQVSLLADGVFPSGINSITWNADLYNSGIYFAVLHICGITESQSMVLIK